MNGSPVVCSSIDIMNLVSCCNIHPKSPPDLGLTFVTIALSVARRSFRIHVLFLVSRTGLLVSTLNALKYD